MSTKFKQNLNVAGNIYLSGNVVADGNVTLGDADTDSITLNADITSSIIPDATDTYDLGTTAKKWRNLDLSQDANIGADINIAGAINSTAAGTPTITSSTDIKLQAGTGAEDRVEISQAPLKLANLTTTERDTKTSQNGDMIYNSTTNQYEVYENGTWRSLGTDQDVADQVAALVDSAPTTLDTLNELAAALGDDPDFATTTATNLGLKLNTADFTSTADTWLATKSTTNVSEGTNLFYTDARADARVDAGFSAKSTTNLSEGTNLYYTNARADARISNNIIDEDNMATDSATRAPSQQSVKAYVDANSGGGSGTELQYGQYGASNATLNPGDTAVIKLLGDLTGNSVGVILIRNNDGNDRLINNNFAPSAIATYTNNTGSAITGVNASMVSNPVNFMWFIDRA